MRWTSALAIYFLFWVFAAFITLPFGVRTADEAGTEKIPGQADSAPHMFDLPRHLRRAAVIGAVGFALFYANWTVGWITTNDLNPYQY